MQILALGGTQFLGRHVVETALARGHHVTLFKVGALLLNLAVVGYLAYRKRLFVGI